jgi:hypothetical protein
MSETVAFNPPRRPKRAVPRRITISSKNELSSPSSTKDPRFLALKRWIDGVWLDSTPRGQRL